MIQASELRIGNWYNEYGIPKKVTAGFIQSLFRIQSFNKLAIDVSPIPLTPEILEKAGFEKKRYNNFYFCYCKGDFVFPYDGKYFFCCTYNETGLFGYSEEVEIMVHQLQNLYFALTGEELQIDL